MKSKLDRDAERIVHEYGIREVIGALSRVCDDKGMPVLFRKLDRLYEWLRS